MSDTTITNEMKGHALIVSKKAKHWNLEIAGPLKVTTSFDRKVRKELLNENKGDELTATRKRRQEHCQRSADSLRRPEFAIHAHEGLRVSGDVDVYLEILQTVVIRPPWIDKVANGGRPPYAFQQDSAPFHKALKTQDWMDGRKFSSSYHTKLMAS
ncbi:unnamed protein product [Hymenolepis diminuta]|uniref:Uncharacterized protein n=1 Tax=Hymenolepis diminuta TaxID=6216 RepID=A0A564Y920_HYMDI|nr:unnamed protein product [Hymenolepis diminuta]